jgi:hypothetical protein
MAILLPLWRFSDSLMIDEASAPARRVLSPCGKVA